MPKLSRRRFAREVVRMLLARPNDKPQVIQQVAAYLIDTNQVKQLDLLVKDMADELFLQNQHMVAQVSHAHAMTDDIRTALEALLMQATGAKTVELTSTLDPSLVGGILVRTPRHELDATVRRQLNQIAGGIK